MVLVQLFLYGKTNLESRSFAEALRVRALPETRQFLTPMLRPGEGPRGREISSARKSFAQIAVEAISTRSRS